MRQTANERESTRMESEKGLFLQNLRSFVFIRGYKTNRE